MRLVLTLLAALAAACSSPVPSASTDAGGSDATHDAASTADAAPDAAGADASSGDASPTSDAQAADALPADAQPDAGGCVDPPGAIRAGARVQEALDRAQPGDTVVVPAGTYRELLEFPRSGTPGAPITLQAACGARPLIDGTGLGAGQAHPALISITGRAHLVVRGLELAGLRGSGGNFPAGIWVRGSARGIQLLDNVVHGIRAENGGAGAGAHGIAVYGTEPSPSEDVLIAGNELFDLVLGWSEALVINGNVRGFEVRNNVVHDVDNIAFDFIGFEADVCPSCAQGDVVSDDVNRARDGWVHGNHAYAMSTAANPAYGGEKSAACFYVDGGADLIIERNRAERCDLGVELASEHFGRSTARVIVRSNFIFGNDVTGVATGGYDSGNGPGGGSAEDCLVVHNTIYDSARSGWAEAGILLQNRNQRNVYRNNVIVATPGTRAVAASGALNQGNVLDDNLYFGGGLEGVTDGGGSLTADPLLVDPARGDLHLRPTSPARGRAASLAEAGASDFDGEPRIQGAPDVGADERP